MTDDPKALIAEARERAARLLGDEPCSPIITESIISRLADALERAERMHGDFATALRVNAYVAGHSNEAVDGVLREIGYLPRP